MKGKCALLHKSLYSLKQSPRHWYLKFDKFMSSIDFSRWNYDSYVYLEKQGRKVITYLLLYVDDMLIESKSMMRMTSLKTKLNTHFEMKDVGQAKRILGMEILRNKENGGLFLSQKGYIEKVLIKICVLSSWPTIQVVYKSITKERF